VTDAGKKVPPIVRSKPIKAQINSIGAGIIADVEGRRKKEEGRRQEAGGRRKKARFGLRARVKRRKNEYRSYNRPFMFVQCQNVLSVRAVTISSNGICQKVFVRGRLESPQILSSQY